MKLLKVDNSSADIKFSFDDLGILHYALYDYLGKVEAKLNHKDQNKHRAEMLGALKDNLQSMVETVNGVI